MFPAYSLKLFSLLTKMWALSLKLASCHPSDSYNFEVAPTCFEKLWTPGLGYVHTGTDSNKEKRGSR
jgi:hypothetical protein